MATSDPITQNSTTSPNCQINLRKSPMIWKDYFTLSEIASYSKLARASKAPPSPLPGGIGLNSPRGRLITHYDFTQSSGSGKRLGWYFFARSCTMVARTTRTVIILRNPRSYQQFLHPSTEKSCCYTLFKR